MIYSTRLSLVIASIVAALVLLYNCHGVGIIYNSHARRAARSGYERWARSMRYNKMGIGRPIYHSCNEE